MACCVSHIWITAIIYIISQLYLKLSLLCFSFAVVGLVLSSGSQEAKSALCFSFIRQMSPSQAMNNHSAPSVRLHPPGLVRSLLASVPCHGLALAVCLPQHLFFSGMARRCFVSVWLYLFASVFLFPRATVFFFTSFSFFLSVLLTQTPQSNEQADYVREKREHKKREKDVLPPGE